LDPACPRRLADPHALHGLLLVYTNATTFAMPVHVHAADRQMMAEAAERQKAFPDIVVSLNGGPIESIAPSTQARAANDVSCRRNQSRPLERSCMCRDASRP
jgi:hypothetical protein